MLVSWEALALIMLCVAVLAVGGGLWLRSLRTTNSPDSAATDLATPPSGDESETEGVVLVPLPNGRNEALALGTDATLDAFESSGLGRRSDVGSAGPLRQVVRQVINVGGQGATKRADKQIDAGRIVSLSDETMKQLATNKAAHDKAGNMLGLVRGNKGTITHVMRLDRAGAKAVTASNAATLAMTAALSQQLEHIEEQLTEIRETLGGLVADTDRERLAKAVAANAELLTIADRIRRHGEMTDADRNDLSEHSLPVTTSVIETEFRFEEIEARITPFLGRGERQDELDRLRGKERLEYWLAIRVEVELAQTRRDLLHLYWEQSRHPETADQLAQDVRKSIAARQERMRLLGELLSELADPESRTRLDPLRQVSRYRLKKQQAAVVELLSHHGDAFAGPEEDSFAVIEPPTSQDAYVLSAESADTRGKNHAPLLTSTGGAPHQRYPEP